MKVVILAGGFGTRISEESHLKPKPMIEIGEKPIMWHIMKYYSQFGYNEFIICLGYNAEPWKVTLIDTGLNTMTGGRVKRIKEYVGNEPFMLTYGDGLANIDLKALEEFHRSHGKLATITAVNIGQRFGVLDLEDNGKINSFREKNDDDGSLINGGYMVLNPGVFDYIEGDSTVFEQAPLRNLAKDGELMAYRHEGFWKCMDTQREKQQLEAMWQSGNAPWKIWE